MGTKFTVKASDGHTLNAYRADPEGTAHGGVVVIGEVWGVNKWVRSVVDRYARHGYVAVAPNLMDRIKFGFESEDYAAGSAYSTMAEQMKSFSFDKALLDVEAVVKVAAAGGKVGITGYCFGGNVTWRASHAGLGLSAGSGYYGGGVASYVDLEPQVPLEMHYSSQDAGVPLEQVEALKKRHPNVGVYTYEGAHGFCNSDRPDKFDEPSCKKASARTAEFFRKHLG